MRREQYMSPLSNTVFLGIYANCENDPEREGSLRGLINAIMADSRPPIEKIEKVQVEDADLGEHYGAKGVRIDLLVTDCFKQKYIIEVQLYPDLYMMKRNWVYISRIINRQLGVGDDYSKLKPVVMINIADFTLFDEDDVPGYYNVGSLMLRGTQHVVSNDLTFFFVEIPKFLKRENKEELTKLDLWLEYFVNYSDEKRRKELAAMSNAIGAFDKAYNHLLDDDDLWFKYEAERRNREAYMTGMMTARDLGYADGIAEGKEMGREVGVAEGKEMGIAEGKEMGIAEGKEMGIAEGKEMGIAEGREAGIAEGMAKGKTESIYYIVKNLKAENVPPELIAKYTGLSIESVNSFSTDS